MTDDLLELAFSDPERAERQARSLLEAPGSSLQERISAARALGLVLRGRGAIDEALVPLRLATRLATGLARSTGDAELLADVRGTYGVTVAYAGRPRAGLRHLDAAVTVPGAHHAMTLMRRAAVLDALGRYGEARADVSSAVEAFRRDGDLVWEARALHNLGWSEMNAGHLDAAARHTARARAIFSDLGHDLPALWAEQNLGELAGHRGDLVAALRLLDRCAARYDDLGHHRPGLALARARTYLAAGLPAEAATVVEPASADPAARSDERAWMRCMSAEALLASGEPEAALVDASAAATAFREIGTPLSRHLADLLALRASVAARGTADPARARAVARALHAQRHEDAPTALVLAARLARTNEAELLGQAATYRTRGSTLSRAPAWLGQALLCERGGDRGGLLRACGRGLDELDRYRSMLGSTELRALATGHGRELAGLALRHAAHDPRALLTWSERWRATSLAQPPVTAGDQPVLASLAALRDNVRRLVEARAEGEPTDQLDKDRARLEREVRAEHHRRSGQLAETRRFDVRRLVDEVGEVDGGCLVELVDVDGVLHVLVVHDGRVRRRMAGTTQAALALTQSAAFVLRRAARGRPYTPGDLGRRLQDELLGDAARLVPDGPVTVVPTGRLHGVPWALLPALERRAFAVVPSAGQWLRARAVPASGGGTVLLAGPGLGTGGAEVPVLAARNPGAHLLTGEQATVGAAMAALDGAHLAHLAAHGRFRADSPLFSSLEMTDGPLTVYDLERLAVAPYRMVLSACESGVLAPVGADELLGLASALFALGTAGLVCSVAEVNDEATAELMVDLHTHLDAGADPAGALLAVREARPAEPTAASFVALGI